MVSDKQLDRIKEYFTNRSEIAAVYFYGSQAENRARQESDIDLGILLKKMENATINFEF